MVPLRRCIGVSSVRGRIALGVALLLTIAAPPAGAARGGNAGTLDSSFGDGGKVFAAAAPAIAETEFAAAARQGDGKLVVELQRGIAGPGSPAREIERRLPNGELDPSFGEGGRVPVGYGGGLALRPDGTILIGTQACGPGKGSIELLDPTGHQATTFGRDGCGPKLGFSPKQIVTAVDDTIFLAGDARYCPCGKDYPTYIEPVVAKLRADGAPDLTFGKGGLVHVRADLGIQPAPVEEVRTAEGIAPTASGGVDLAAGNLLIGVGPDGNLAPAVGKGGEVKISGYNHSLLGLSNGKLVVAAAKTKWGFEDAGPVTIQRLLPDGTPDPTFGEGGTTELALSGPGMPRALAPAPGEGVLVGGEIGVEKGCAYECTANLFVARLGANGRPDPGYGAAGIAALPPLPSLGYQSAAEIVSIVDAPDGSAVVVGGPNAADAFAIATTPSGALDPSFGDHGSLIERHFLPPSAEPTDVALGPKGEITVAAQGTSGAQEFGGLLFGFQPNGAQTKGATGEGDSITAARGEIEPARGGVVAWWENQELVAADRDGSPLAGYGRGRAIELPKDFEARAIAAGPNGDTLVLGSVNEQRAMGIWRLGPTGRPVAGFGHHGLAKVRFGREAAVAFAATTAAGDIFVTGYVNGRTGAAKLLPDGRLDYSFGFDGRFRGPTTKVSTYGRWIAGLGGGVVIGKTRELAPGTLDGMIRLDRRGHRVQGFGRVKTTPATAGRVLGIFAHHGRVVVVVARRNRGQVSGGVELRGFRADGLPDLTYGRRGLAAGGISRRHHFEALAAIQQSDGRIIVAGSAAFGERAMVELMRFR